MKILIDTNILFSALLFPNSKPAKALMHTAKNHEMYLSDRNIAELKEILKRKKPELLPDAEVLLSAMSYELIPAIRLRRETDKRFKRPTNFERSHYG